MRTLGTPETVAALTQVDLAEFRDRHLVGRNGVISVFGNVRAAEVNALVEAALGAMPAGEPALVAPAIPQPPGEEIRVEQIKNKAQAVLMVGFLASDMYSEDRVALELIDEACSDLGSRFFVRIREQMGLAYFVGSGSMLGLVRGPFVFYLGTDPAKIDAVREAMLDEIRLLAEDGLTDVELARAKEKMLGSFDIRNQSNNAFAFATALDELYGLGANHYRELRKQIESTTLEEVQRVARKYFRDQVPVIATVRPETAAAS